MTFTLSNLGWLLHDSGQYREAEAIYRLTRSALGECLLRQGERVRAEPLDRLELRADRGALVARGIAELGPRPN